MRRILSRAAVLVGGAAAAWLFSAATASADVSEPDVVKPVVDVLTESGPAQTNPQQFKDFVEAVLPEPPAPPADLDEVGQHVQGAVEQVAAQLNLPAKAELGEPSAPAKLRLLSLGDHDAPPVVQPVAATPQLAPVVPVAPERVAAHDIRRALGAESPRLAPPVSDEAPELPALPRLPLPMPLPVPTAPTGACTSCGNGGSNDDFGIAVAHTWPIPASGFATSQALRLVSQHVSPAAGEQPGVTPD